VGIIQRIPSARPSLAGWMTSWKLEDQNMLSEKQICYIHTNKLNILRNALALHLFCVEDLASMLLIFLFPKQDSHVQTFYT